MERDMRHMPLILHFHHAIFAPSQLNLQSGRSPKEVALFSATKFSSYIIELLQLQDAIQI